MMTAKVAGALAAAVSGWLLLASALAMVVVGALPVEEDVQYNVDNVAVADAVDVVVPAFVDETADALLAHERTESVRRLAAFRHTDAASEVDQLT